MKKFSKLVAGAAVLGAAAYGVYSYLNKLEEDFDYEESDIELEPAGEEAEEAAEDDVTAVDDAAETFKQAANRAYTTIQHGSKQAMDKVKEAVGPKGEEVLSEVGVAAKEMGKTVVESATKIREILQEKDEELSEENAEEAADASVPSDEAVETVSFEVPAEAAGGVAEKTAEAEAPAEAAAEAKAQESVIAGEDPDKTPDADIEITPEEHYDSYVTLRSASAEHKSEETVKVSDLPEVEQFFNDEI